MVPAGLNSWEFTSLQTLKKWKILIITLRLKKIENCLKTWSNQLLTPIGKITVVKTLIISKLNYLFLTLCIPKLSILKQFISKLYNFIWDGKPDKISRDIISKDYCNGGLKMVNIPAYIKGLKLTWIRRAFKSSSKVYRLLTYSENINLVKLAYLGTYKQLKNPFWNEVFTALTELQGALPISEENINKTSL